MLSREGGDGKVEDRKEKRREGDEYPAGSEVIDATVAMQLYFATVRVMCS